MKRIFFLLFISTFYLMSCKTEKQITKSEQIRHVITESGFLTLPMKFDIADLEQIEQIQNKSYTINPSGNDSLLFGGDNDFISIVGFLPDTTDYYAFLCFVPRDMEMPSIRVMDKNWQIVDEKIIATGGCAGHARIDISSCYDSVRISDELIIKSVSKVLGTVELDDSIATVIPICNTRVLDGFIDKYGHIEIKKSGLIDCN